MSVERYYDNLGKSYIAGDAHLLKYHDNRFEIARYLLRGLGGPLYDFGCGSGELLEQIDGFTCSGCDLSAELLAIARRKVPEGDFRKGGLDTFLSEDGPYSVVVALNVLPYLSETEERQFFEHAARISTYCLVSHTNALFDVVSFNRYTADFFEQHFDDAIKAEGIASAFRDALPFAHLPANENASERDVLDKRRVNPFTYTPEGWRVLEMRPLNFFPFPPQLIQSREDWRMAQLDARIDDPTLQKLFCSQFQMLLRVVSG